MEVPPVAEADGEEDPECEAEEGDPELAGRLVWGEEAGGADVTGLVAGGVDTAGEVGLGEAGGVEPTGVEPAGVLEAALPELADKQLVSGPLLMVKAADWARAPVLSRSVRPMEVPAAILVFQVKILPWRPVNCSSASPPGVAPGRILYMARRNEYHSHQSHS